MLVLFFAPLALITAGVVSHTFLVFLLYVTSGIGMSGIGMGIMHDAIHGSYSKNKHINLLMANTINLIGASKEMWRLQHNVLHHSYTNIEEHDEDIHAPFFLRFSPHAKKNGWHKYQHWYAWFFYGLSTVSWITVKDFINLRRYSKMGLIRGRKAHLKTLCSIIGWKLFFYAIVLFLPIYFTSISPVVLVLAFLTMLFVTGLSISIVFQVAHVMPNTEYPLPDSQGAMENERLTHQLLTTCNFSQQSGFMFWFLGGLTNQIEHHLFPNISHIHYRKIAPIVKKTAEEFGLPYNANGSFLKAVRMHFKMLKQLGSAEVSEHSFSH